MAAIDKIYGSQEQYNELNNYLLEHHPYATKYLYPKRGYGVKARPISNFPERVDKWLLKNCTIDWVKNYIKNQYDMED